jgi:hypothetical protein
LVAAGLLDARFFRRFGIRIHVCSSRFGSGLHCNRDPRVCQQRPLRLLQPSGCPSSDTLRLRRVCGGPGGVCFPTGVSGEPVQ